MTRRGWVSCALGAWLVMGAGAVSGSARNPAAGELALWVWEVETYALLEDGDVADEAIAFLRRHHVDTVYLYADAFDGRNWIADRPERYQDLISRLHASGIGVHALLGSAYLNTETYVLPEYRDEARTMFRRIIDYNRRAPHAARFDGVNLDIEPEALPQWNAQTRAGLLGHFLDMSAELMALKRACGQRMAVGPALGLGLENIELSWRGQRKTVLELMIDLYDYVALMDYRSQADGPDGIIAHAQAAVDYGSRVKKPVVIGLETAPHDEHVTFQHLPPQAMALEQAKVVKALGHRPGFGGFALHHYQSWRAWLERAAP